MLHRLKEAIRVAVVFSPGGKVRPVWFEWHRQKHTIKETTYTWGSMTGNAHLLHFAVTDGGNLFELTWNTQNQVWTLNSIEMDG